MNAKHLFYKKYYEKIDLRKFEDEAAFEQIKKRNEPLFADANKQLIDYTATADATATLLLRNVLAGNTGFREIKLKTTYPGLFLGSGYNHETGNIGEFKLGFFFDHTSGLPVVPGSSVKGVLRSVFPQFKRLKDGSGLPDLANATELQRHKALYIAQKVDLPAGNQDVAGDKLCRLIHRMELSVFEGISLVEKDGNWSQVYRPMSERDTFLDAVPDIRQGAQIFGRDAITPHHENPLKNPKPLPFLKVLPNVRWCFQFLFCNNLEPGMALSPDRKKALFERILRDIGVGAKTNVGYGQFDETH